MTTQAAVFSAEEVGAILSSPSYVRNILLVCTGNTCRSPMAAALLKQALASRQVCDVNVESAGLWVVPGSTVTPNSVKALAARGIDISKHVPRMLDAVKVKSAELILTMTRSQKETIVSMFPDAAGKVFTMSEYAYGAAGSAEDVLDPYGGPLGVYEETANQLAKLADLIAARFQQQRGNGACGS